jgi:hypothetical protein
MVSHCDKNRDPGLTTIHRKGSHKAEVTFGLSRKSLAKRTTMNASVKNNASAGGMLIL